MKKIIHGFGQMGQMVLAVAQTTTSVTVMGIVAARDSVAIPPNIPHLHTLNEVVEVADVLIDFSHPALLPDILSFAQNTHTNLVLATSGYTTNDLDLIAEASKHVAILQAYNMSYGIAVLQEVVQRLTEKFSADFDIEIIEKHHNKKVDVPSGTAKLLYESIHAADQETYPVYERLSDQQSRSSKEVGIHSLRGGTIFGEHTVVFAGNDEIIEIKHEALSKKIFATGSLKAAAQIATKKTGLFDNKMLL